MNKNNDKTIFEVNPLDVNIAKIQYNLLKKSETEITENLIENYVNKDITIKLDELKVICRAKDKQNINLEIICTKRNDSEPKSKILYDGSRNQFAEYLNKKDFFESIKEFVLKL